VSRLRPLHVLAAAALLAAVGTSRTAYQYLVREARVRPLLAAGPRAGAAWAAIERALPPAARVGYLSADAGLPAFEDQGYTVATFALAPRIVVRGAAGVDAVVAAFASAAELERLCAAHGLAPERVGDGVALLRRVAR
jgi:hypothetical protein